MRRTLVVRLLLAAVVLTGCAEPWPRPPSQPYDQFVREFEAWRSDRRTRLVAPGSGPVTWVGLWELNDGVYALGSDSTLPIVLAASHSPPLAGTIRRTATAVTFEPVPGAHVLVVDSATSTPVRGPLTLRSDRTKTPTVLALGAWRLRVHGEPGTDRLWLRAWDIGHPARESFQLPESYPLDTLWRLSARLERFDTPRDYQVADIADGTQVYRSPGTLHFRVKDVQHRLVAFADSSSTSYHIMVWDSTANSTTYQAGRYVRAPLADSTGWTVIDFNRTYNPPCVFSPHSTCGFAPKENRLSFALTAGEKRVK